MSTMTMAAPTHHRCRRGRSLKIRLSALVLMGGVILGPSALSQPSTDCASAELAVRQRVMPLLLNTDPKVASTVRSSITIAKLARAHCLSGRTERALRLYEQIVTDLDPFAVGPDRDLADELWR